MGRKPKLENSDPSINFRLPDELKLMVEQAATKERITVSKYLRGLVAGVMDGSFCEEAVMTIERNNFLSSMEFLKLVVWIYAKKESNKFDESAEEMDGYIRTLKRVDDHLPRAICSEFEKVLLDILNVRAESNRVSYELDFKFCRNHYNGQMFDYGKWEEYILKNEGEMDRETLMVPKS